MGELVKLCNGCAKPLHYSESHSGFIHRSQMEELSCPLIQKQMAMDAHPSKAKRNPNVSSSQMQDLPDNVVNLDEYRKRKNGES